MPSQIQDLETNRFFRSMAGLAAAKENRDPKVLLEWIDELMMLALCGGSHIRQRAESAASEAETMLLSIQAERMGWPGALHITALRPDVPANDEHGSVLP